MNPLTRILMTEINLRPLKRLIAGSVAFVGRLWRRLQLDWPFVRACAIVHFLFVAALGCAAWVLSLFRIDTEIPASLTERIIDTTLHILVFPLILMFTQIESLPLPLGLLFLLANSLLWGVFINFLCRQIVLTGLGYLWGRSGDVGTNTTAGALEVWPPPPSL